MYDRHWSSAQDTGTKANHTRIHLAEDRNQLDQARRSGFAPSQLLLDAIELNETAIDVEDSDDSTLTLSSIGDSAYDGDQLQDQQLGSQSTDISSKVLSWQESQASLQQQLDDPNDVLPAAQDVDADQQDINWAFDFDPQPGDDLGLEPATDEEDVHMIDDNTATPNGSSDASVSPSSSASAPNHDGDEDLVAADLPLFFDDQDENDEDSSEEVRSGREDNGDSLERSSMGNSDNDQMEADADLHQPERVEENQDRPPQSRYGQQLLDQFIGDYRPGPCPHGAPRAADVVVSLYLIHLIR
ncbi:hypothetical protein CF327_g5271 [Tilletia walkeri]|nr:hypothetical protein CF327_g5271 [Tilletia walkeri]